MKHRLFILVTLLSWAIQGSAVEALSTMAAKIEKLLPGIPEIHSTVLGNAIVLSGEIDNPGDLERAIGVVDGLRTTTIHNLLRLSDRGRKSLEKQIETEIGLNGVKIHLLGSRMFLEGTVDNDFEADRTVEVAKAFIFTPMGPPGPRIPPPPPEPVGVGSAKSQAAREAWEDSARKAWDEALKRGEVQASDHDRMPVGWNRNRLPAIIVDLLRVRPKDGGNVVGHKQTSSQSESSK